MAYEVSELHADPPIDIEVVERASGRARRLTTYSGSARLAPVGEVDPEAAHPVAFYVPEAPALGPSVAATSWIEVSLAQVAVARGAEPHPGLHGVGDADLQHVVDDQQGGVQWLAISFNCYGGQPMVVRYRVTVMQPTG